MSDDESDYDISYEEVEETSSDSELDRKIDQEFQEVHTSIELRKCKGCSKELSILNFWKYDYSHYYEECKECMTKQEITKSGIPSFERQVCNNCSMELPLSDFKKCGHRNINYRRECKFCIKDRKMQASSELDSQIVTKVCKICSMTLPLSKFHKNTSGLFGRHPDCKTCRQVSRRGKRYERKQSGTRICPRCKQEKDISKFHTDRCTTDGLQTNCMNCQRDKTQKWKSTFDGFMVHLFHDIRHNAKKRAKSLNIEITKQDVIDLYHKQRGLCALTRFPMTHLGYIPRGRSEFIMNRFNISVDRIDSSKGYTIDNIQLVCAIINRMKTDLSQLDFVKLCTFVANVNHVLLIQEMTASQQS